MLKFRVANFPVRTPRTSLVWIGCCVFLFWPIRVLAQVNTIAAPPDFEVKLFAGDDLAHDIYSLTFNANSEVVVSGPGYVKRLIDADGDGAAEKAVVYAEGPKSGAFGMCFVGPDLICTGDNSLLRFTDADGDGVADGKPEVLATLNTAEHGSHSIVQGPDGWFYVMCGNDAKVSEKHVNSPASPITTPANGCLLRYSPDFKKCEVVAHGFRNACDFAFNKLGHVFTIDSDGERDQYLPWYSPTRLFDIGLGQHHGWVNLGHQSSWNRPEVWFDNVERLSEIGRGSPTGVCIYRHTAFPEVFREGVFGCCWTLGKIYYFPLQRRGSSYTVSKNVFLESKASAGFAPTDIEVGPAGQLFVSVGGRGTQGSVYCVTYKGKLPPAPAPKNAKDGLALILNAPQPDSTWSRAQWLPLAKSAPAAVWLDAAADKNRTSAERLRAIEIHTELHGGLSASDAIQVAHTHDVEASCRAIWSMARRGLKSEEQKLVCYWLSDKDPRVQRSVWEALATTRLKESLWTDAAWVQSSTSADRRVRALSAEFGGPLMGDVPQPETAPLAWWYAQRDKIAKTHDGIARGILALEKPTKDPQRNLEIVRFMQLSLGDAFVDSVQPEILTGFLAHHPEWTTADDKALKLLIDKFPSNNNPFDLELARLLAMLGVESTELLTRLADKCTATSTVESDIHYLCALSRVRGKRSAELSQRVAAALANLHHKMAAKDNFASRNWPDGVGELYDELAKNDAGLAAAIVADARFRLPSQSLFAHTMPEATKQAAARKLLAEAKKTPDERWTPNFVQLISGLPAGEALPALRAQWKDFTIRDSIALALAKEPLAEDRERLVESLASAEPQLVEKASQALAKLGGEATPADVTQAIAALRRYCLAPRFQSVRKALAELLTKWSGKTIDIQEKDPAKDNAGGKEVDFIVLYEPWFAWFRETHAKEADQLAASGVPDWAQWQARLEKVEWKAGLAEEGRQVFEKRNCFRCHSGSSRFGPDLTGAANRFSKQDLFKAIVDPNKDVSPLYRTVQAVTASGRTELGIVVYESPEGTLLQTGFDTTIRIAGDEIVAMKLSQQSLMPAGLLNGATDLEIAHLYAYLQTLAPVAAPAKP